MVFEISNKVAIIAGGASGIGLLSAEQFLINGAKGVCLADINEKVGESALADLKSRYGASRTIFVKTDVTNYQQYEETFKRTLEQFGSIDILFNNAGILNDKIWEKEIDVNIKGTINGILLGLEKYIQKYKSGEQGVIINSSSIAGVNPAFELPVYSMTKSAAVALTLSFGDKIHYERTKVKVITIAPGITRTPIFDNIAEHTIGPHYKFEMDEQMFLSLSQSAEHVAESLIQIIQKAPTGTIWVVEEGLEPYEWIQPDRKSFITK